jgi:23S rRNA (cytosine1962-C5)-methyltransferase
MQHAILKTREERRLLRGHLWAYRNEFNDLPVADEGEVVEVRTAVGRLVGRGFYQAEGGIAVRLLTRKSEDVDAAFLQHRIRRAGAYREGLWPGATTYRWVYGESDGLPGLVADRYGSVVVAQSTCGFYLSRQEALAQEFMAAAGVEGVVFRGPHQSETFGDVPPEVECGIDTLRFRVDTTHHQKTGLFLDQRENRKLVVPWADGATVFDGHCYQGLWSCTAAWAGAARVVGVDSSGHALERARLHAELNGLSDRCVFEEGDVQQALRRGDRYDVVILDPPALAKSRGGVNKALALYRALNRDAMQALRPGGVLITSSCSHFVSREAFLETMKRAAIAAQRPCWLVAIAGAAPDHPVLLAMPETEYLTCAVFRVF